MIKRLVSLSFGSAALLGASLAAAQPAGGSAPAGNPNCPPGSWFCADTQAQPAAPAGQPVQPLTPLPSNGAPATQPAPNPPPVVVYQPPPPVVVVQPAHPEQPPPVYVYTPRE